MFTEKCSPQGRGSRSASTSGVVLRSLPNIRCPRGVNRHSDPETSIGGLLLSDEYLEDATSTYRSVNVYVSVKQGVTQVGSLLKHRYHRVSRARVLRE